MLAGRSTTGLRPLRQLSETSWKSGKRPLPSEVTGSGEENEFTEFVVTLPRQMFANGDGRV